MGITDLKLYTLNALALSVTLTNIEPILKIVLLLVSIVYTLMRTFTHLKGPDKTKDKNDN
jgi:hypothetical protein